MTNIRQRNVGFILIGIGIVLMAVGVYELAQSDMFKSAARIKEPADFHGEFDDVFETTKEILLSDVTLSNVVYRLELREKWDKKWDEKYVGEDNLPGKRQRNYFNGEKIKTVEAVSLMRDRLEVIQVPNTTLADIVFVSDDAAEAALIANMVAEVYRDWRIEIGQRLAQAGTKALKAQLEVEDKKIRVAQKELDRLQKEFNIPDAEVGDVSARTNFPPYWEARRNLEELTDLRRLITRKMNIEEVDLRRPYHPPEIIVERAIPATTPVRHHRLLGVAFTLVGLALFACGLASVWKSRPLIRRDAPA